MTIDALIVVSGMLVTLLPFLGFPLKYDNVILVALGIIVMMLGIIVRRRSLARRVLMRNETFVESIPRTNEPHAE